jgi:succinate dehydrogenase / fumarate reductase iron-sulfur subunit
VASALLQLQIESNAERAPLVFESGCLEALCGSCTLVVNGRVQKACITRLSSLGAKVTLEPLSKFPVVRDLVVDRTRMLDALDRVTQPGTSRGLASDDSEKVSSQQQELSYVLSRCSSCGACLEACPQYSKGGDFVGAALLNHVRRRHLHAHDKGEAASLVESVMTEGGVADCGKAQNCVEACPLDVPTVDSIQHVAGEASKRLLFGWWLG